MLDRAMPADAVPGSTIPEDTEAEIQLRDGTWVWAQVIGQRKDRQGHWCVGLRWYASPSVGGREGWYLLDSRYIRRPNPALSRQTRHSRDRQCSSWPRIPGRCRAWLHPHPGPAGITPNPAVARARRSRRRLERLPGTAVAGLPGRSRAPPPA